MTTTAGIDARRPSAIRRAAAALLRYGRRVGTVGRLLPRFIWQTRDPNFIGFDKYRRKGAYHWDALERDPDYAAKLDFILSQVRRDDLCVDLGCGDGAYMAALSHVCRLVVGVDADWDGVRVAKRQLRDVGALNCQVVQAAFSQLSAKRLGIGEPIDLVYSMDVLEHLMNPDELLVKACELVRPGGLVVIGTPLYIAPELVSPHHVREYTKTDLRALLSKYLSVVHEAVLEGKRKDGRRYQEDYAICVGHPLQREAASPAGSVSRD
jgi:SAM-dependent methyltransferase